MQKNRNLLFVNTFANFQQVELQQTYSQKTKNDYFLGITLEFIFKYGIIFPKIEKILKSGNNV